MFPSEATIGLGVAITAVLAIIDWFVWRTAPVLPYPLTAETQGCADREATDFKEVA
ncbi:MAG TPA: hypothetical protein VHS07_06405 [Candidatus Binataceae bacterium]|jgi:hypothetical protein|nr:hypothetical protein [Candidatus Binataceae bacterium]